MKNFKIAITLTLLISNLSYGGHGKEGGELRLVSMAEIASYITNELKRDLIESIKVVRNAPAWSYSEIVNDLEQDSDLYYISELEKLIEKGLKDDILKSKYNIRNTACTDSDGNEKDASSVSLDRGGEICWAPSRIINSGGILKSELIGLAFHEHVHHFGIKDNEVFGHPRAALFSKYMKKFWTSEKSGYGLVIKVSRIENGMCKVQLSSRVLRGEYRGKSYKIPMPLVLTNYSRKEVRKKDKEYSYPLGKGGKVLVEPCNRMTMISSINPINFAYADFEADWMENTTKIYIDGVLRFNSTKYLAAVKFAELL